MLNIVHLLKNNEKTHITEQPKHKYIQLLNVMNTQLQIMAHSICVNEEIQVHFVGKII